MLQWEQLLITLAQCTTNICPKILPQLYFQSPYVSANVSSIFAWVTESMHHVQQGMCILNPSDSLNNLWPQTAAKMNVDFLYETWPQQNQTHKLSDHTFCVPHFCWVSSEQFSAATRLWKCSHLQFWLPTKCLLFSRGILTKFLYFVPVQWVRPKATGQNITNRQG